MQGKGQVEPDEDVLEDGIAFAGVAKFPARIKCALLSLDGLEGRDRARPWRQTQVTTSPIDHGDLPEVPEASERRPARRPTDRRRRPRR